MRYNSPFGTTDPEASFGSQPYINGNPATGTMGSIPPAASIEFDQREIVAVIQYAADHGLIDYTATACQPPSNSDLKQLLKAIFGIANKTSNILTQNVVYYVNNVTGSDTLYDGSSATVSGAHGPFATMAHALAIVGQFAPGTYGATINVSAGTYPAWASVTWAHCPVTINGAGYSGGGRTFFQNSAANSTTITVQGPNGYRLNNFAVAAQAAGQCCCLTSAYRATTIINNIWIEGTNNYGCAFQAFLGDLYIGNVWFNAQCGTGVQCAGAGANLDLSSAVVAFNVVQTFANEFASSHILGNLGVSSNGNTCQFVGAGNVYGTRYYVDYNAIINVSGMGPNFFPGSVPGGSAWGGQYA